MRKEYEEDLRVAKARGVVSEEEAESLLAEALRQGRHPLELLMDSGVLSHDTFAEIQAAARGAAAPKAEGPQAGATLSLKRAAAEPRPADPLSPGSPTLTIQPAPQPAAPPPGVEVPLSPGSPTLTIKPAPHTGPSSQEPAFPAPGWERYQPVRFLGQGGMGRVYLAYDPILRRNVALKFVRGDDPELLRRFVSEAQAQARVEHERVCKVYEVGEVQGQPFIAMQYVSGRSLHELTRELSVEQKVMVVQQATEGVHAAHRAGLIHRDIKPSNILVERGEDGRWKPYVMDFGLARDWQRETTVTGTVLGTPHYMAPEQARGEVSQLDRRADVYSLGATLYFLLTGQTPIPGSNALEVLSNLATQEPRPLRALNRNVPADLEAIVLKCLEREPSARYDSARALAEDLGRFLNGEPVRARAVGSWYRLRKWALRHRTLVSMATVALVLVGLALGQVVLTQRDATLNEHLTRRFTELASDVGVRARLIALSRLHDTSAGRQALRERLTEIETEMRRGGERALGPGHYALGQGWLDLGDPARAREHLEEALRYDFQNPRVASALALALGQLYREQLLSLGSLTPEQRQARRGELARLYREPAMSWLRRSQGESLISAEYMEALLASYEERYDEALAQLGQLGEQSPWFYEAPRLQGDILLMRALVRWDEGKQTEAERAQVQAALEEARQAYTQAADTAQSAPEVHYGLARVESVAVSMDLYGRGEVQPYIERALDHLSRALRVAPDHAASWALQASLYRSLAESRILQGKKAEEPLRRAVESARSALAHAPSQLEALKELGMALWHLASEQKKSGLDPRESLRQASEAFESIAPDKRDFFTHHGLGLVSMTWADYEEERGEDSLRHRNEAIEAFRKALELDADYASAWINLAAQYYARARHPKAPTAEEDLEQARQAVEKGRAFDRQSVVAHNNAGLIHMLRAQRLRDAGADERPALAEAIASFREGLTINPGVVEFHQQLGMAHGKQAQGAWDRGEDPLPLLDQAQQSFERARDLAPQDQWAYMNLSHLHATRAVYLHARAEDPRPSARAALEAAREAAQRAPEHAYPLINLGYASQLLAAFTLEAQGDPRPYLAEALEQLQKALERAPGVAETRLHLAGTRAVQARWQARQGRAVDKDFEQAAQSYEQAIQSSGRHPDYRLAFGRFCRDWASWRQQAGLDPHPPLEQGLEQADAVLAARPEWAEARALRASLQIRLSNSRPSAAPQLSRALQELREALVANPNLKHRWAEVPHQAR
ncbi:MAG: protein kinase [Myxococcaceae bacterium]|nr:protein kinase [Myxococcaceae bacterium]